MDETFQESFCRHFQVPPERYSAEVLRRTLTPQAHVLRWFLLFRSRIFFTADREFIAAVGQLTRHGDFRSEIMDFHNHPDNRGFLRRTLRARVSASLLRHIIGEVWPDFAARRARTNPTLSPFDSSGEPPAPPTAIVGNS